MAWECSLGRMVEFIKDNGKMVNSMVMEYIQMKMVIIY